MVKIFLAASDGLKVTHWFANILKRIPSVELVDSLDACDVVCVDDLTTNDYFKNVMYISQYVQKFAATKPLCIFLHDDPCQDMGFMHHPQLRVHLFRTSLYRSLKHDWEDMLPSFQCQDQNTQPFEPVPNRKPDDPITVGFVGALTCSDRKLLCDTLANDKRFQTSFVFRRGFHLFFDEKTQAQNVAEFRSTVKNNVFQLCCRGTGNFSHRFYEVLASGRVPVLPDTDLVLPLHIPRDVWINCVVMASNITTIPDAIVAFALSHNMEQVQRNCRDMWTKYLSYEGFAPVVESRLASILAK